MAADRKGNGFEPVKIVFRVIGRYTVGIPVESTQSGVAEVIAGFFTTPHLTALSFCSASKITSLNNRYTCAVRLLLTLVNDVPMSPRRAGILV